MIITKKIKFRIIIVFILLVLLFLYRLSPYKLEFLGHYDKIWAHRANSIEKLHSALKYYEGVELDLIYDEKEDFLDINHPPTKSIELKFENYINSLNQNQQPYLWLDIKNLNKDNAEAILNRLLEIFNQKRYPFKKVLIEAHYPEALPIFTKTGFKTSYYLPYFMYKKDQTNLEKDIKHIKQVLDVQPEIGISTSYKDYFIIKEHFPNQTKYIWTLVPFINWEVIKSRKILEDKTVKVVLVNYVALEGNR